MHTCVRAHVFVLCLNFLNFYVTLYVRAAEAMRLANGKKLMTVADACKMGQYRIVSGSRQANQEKRVEKQDYPSPDEKLATASIGNHCKHHKYIHI